MYQMNARTMSPTVHSVSNRLDNFCDLCNMIQILVKFVAMDPFRLS